MKTTKLLLLIAGICLLTAAPLQAAEVFNSGSNGSYGEMNITADTTLVIPPDGIFHCTTITVAEGSTLKFNKNPLNTPVYLLATGGALIKGTIDVSATGQQGGPGGFDGGFPAFANSPAGDGQGPGGGRDRTFERSAAYAAPAGQNTNVYGNTLLSPLIGGSGGASYSGYLSGGGGGAILISSSTHVTVSGVILAKGGGNVNAGAGSGGAIRVVAPVVDGRGSLNVDGAVGISANDSSYGRTRIDSLDRFANQSLRLA